MSHEIREHLRAYPLKEHGSEAGLRDDLAAYLARQLTDGIVKTEGGTSQPSRMLAVTGIPDIVIERSPSVALEVKYIKKDGATGNVIWSGVGQAFANMLVYESSVLFVQTDVGYTEQYGMGSTKGGVVIEPNEFQEAARRQWGIEIVWADRSGTMGDDYRPTNQ